MPYTNYDVRVKMCFVVLYNIILRPEYEHFVFSEKRMNHNILIKQKVKTHRLVYHICILITFVQRVAVYKDKQYYTTGRVPNI